LAAAPDGKTVYSANAGDSTIAVIDVAFAVPKTEPTPPPAVAVPIQQVSTPSATALAVAVTDFEAQGVAGSVASIVTEWLRDELLRAGTYRLLERRRMDAILSEQTLQQSGCTDQDCAVKLGKLLNVQRMLVGSLGKFEDSYVVVARLVDVETGQAVWSGTTKGKSGDDVEAAVRRLARDLSAAGK
jgi:curli biogenesis system outer membrane secretion channel CsgG